MHEFSPDAWKALISGDVCSLPTFEPTSHPTVVFPGAFNPLHDGHRLIAHLAVEQLGGTLSFELSIQNVDKPRLELEEVRRRLVQFDQQRIVLTSAATFVEKAALFPRATFIVGVDTLLRIGDPRFYGDSHDAMAEAIESITQHECRFLVFGRLVEDAFQTLRDLEIPPSLTALCHGLSEAQFRLDVSSTELRNPS